MVMRGSTLMETLVTTDCISDFVNLRVIKFSSIVMVGFLNWFHIYQILQFLDNGVYQIIFVFRPRN